MNIQSPYFWCSLLLMVFSFRLDAQTLKAYEKKAEEAYQARDYTAALAYNIELLGIDSQRVDALFYAGESARIIRAYEIAERHLEQIPDSAKMGFFTITDFRLANVKKGLEKYDEAIVFYQKFLEERPLETNLFTERAKKELHYCEWALDVLSKDTKTMITQLDTTLVNTNCVDFAPVFYNGLLYYSSADYCDQSPDPSAKIYSRWAKRARVQEINFDPGVDSLRHVSNLAFSLNGRRAYFTLCQDDAYYAGEYRCEIYSVLLDKQQKVISEPQKLPPNINKIGYTTTQPAVGVDPKTGKERLYFVSDRDGGQGGLDIWYANIEKGDMFFGANNLVALNTNADDVTPYYHAPSQTFFFSSEGHRTLGGFDIFETKYENDQWQQPQNLSYPINSSYDDLYYTFNSAIAKGYFASNREGSLCDAPDKGCTCTDIYEAEILVDLKTLVYNQIDSAALEGVTLILRNLATGIVVENATNEAGNQFLFPLKLEEDYEVVATKENYESAKVIINTKGIIRSTLIEEKLYLRPIIQLEVFTFDAINREPLYQTIVQLFDQQYDKDSVVFLPTNSNSVLFPIDFAHQYKITGAKPAYISALDTFNTQGRTTPHIIRKDLYLTPFNLPINLYFDNDRPRYVEWTDTTTNLTYEQTYRRYLNRQITFQRKYSAPLIGNAKEAAQQEINLFFQDEVIRGWNELTTFCQLLIPYLEAGNNLEIVVEGYASPLAAGDYNKKLTGRRVSAVINQLSVYNDGALADYLASQQLILTEAPKGEVDAKDTVSDNAQNRRDSVFSPSASRERRVRILDVKQQSAGLSEN